MAYLILHEAEGGIKVISLKPGVNRLGRNAENDHPIEAESISRVHCEIHVEPDGVRVKDLASSNGTFIDGRRIEESPLVPGQTLGLGSVTLTFEEEPPAALPPASASEPPVRSVGQAAQVQAPPAVAVVRHAPQGPAEACRNHPAAAAAFVCPNCGSRFCSACVRTLRAGMKVIQSCPGCGGVCAPVQVHEQALAREQTSFYRLIPGTFAYPFREGGWAFLIAGAVFFSLLNWASFVAGFAGPIGLAATLILFCVSVGYMFASLKNVAVRTAQGEDRAPQWPEVTSFWDDMVLPAAQFVAIWFVCLGAGVVALFWLPPLVGISLVVCGLFCVPMALLTVSLADSIGGLNPVLVFSSISKVPRPYLAACGVFLVIVAVRTGLERLLDLVPILILPTLIMNFIGFYGLVVEMRLMGLLYRKYKDKLAWFN